MDHLVPPGAEAQPMYEAMVTNTWLAAHTDRLVVGSLVLCDSFRHPAVLAREAVTLDHASGGRFELGIGWGSVAGEIDAFGIGSAAPPTGWPGWGSLWPSSPRCGPARPSTTTAGTSSFETPARPRHPSTGYPSSSAAPAAAPWRWSPPTPTGGTSTPASSTGWTTPGPWPATPGAPCRSRWPWSPTRASGPRSPR